MNNLRTLSALSLAVLILLCFGQAEAQTGSGTAGTITRWTGTTTLGDSAIKEDSNGRIALGTTPNATARFFVLDTSRGSSVAIRGGNSGSGRGVEGLSNTGTGVNGVGSIGVSGLSLSTDPNKAAIQGTALNGAFAGRFFGNVTVTGMLSKAGGSFKIDHPLDPENKYLYHSFVESPDMKNIHDGVVVLDSNGDATVELPEWFEALNRDFRYLLTPIGAPGPGLYIAEEISNNRFRVAGGTAGMKVSWQVTGIRQDAWARKNRIPVEEKKSEIERGYYLHPEAFDQPEERGLEWAHDPLTMRQLKEAREHVVQNRKRQ